MRRWMRNNWKTLLFGIIATAVFVKLAYLERGYAAIGGEWLTIPLIFAVRNFLYEVLRGIYDE